MSYENLETIEQVDTALNVKRLQLGDILVPGQRRIIAEQVDTLLDMRLLMRQVTVGACGCGEAA